MYSTKHFKSAMVITVLLWATLFQTKSVFGQTSPPPSYGLPQETFTAITGALSDKNNPLQQTTVNQAWQAVDQATQNETVMRALAAYARDPSNGNLQAVGQALQANPATRTQLGTDFDPSKLATEPTDAQIGHDGLQNAINAFVTNNPYIAALPQAVTDALKNGTPITDPNQRTELNNTVNSYTQNTQTTQGEAEFLQRTYNTITQNQDLTGDAAHLANVVNNVQTLDEIQNRLRCLDANPQLRSQLCGAAMESYNQTCQTLSVKQTEYGECTPLTIPTDVRNLSADELAELQSNFTAARNATNTQVSQIQSALREQAKQNLAGKTLDVSNILTLKDQEKNIEQRSFINLAESQTGGIVYFISRVIDSLVLGVTSLAVVAFIIAGYMLMFSGIDEQRKEAGKEIIKYTIIGLIFVFASYAIVSFIQGLFFL